MMYGLEFNADIARLLWRMGPIALAVDCWNISHALTPAVLRQENRRFQGTGGVSRNNRDAGFKPAFKDDITGDVYLCQHADGRPSSVHILDGLPSELVLQCCASGRPIAVKPTLVSGFTKGDQFFTREQVAQLLAEQSAD